MNLNSLPKDVPNELFVVEKNNLVSKKQSKNIQNIIETAATSSTTNVLLLYPQSTEEIAYLCDKFQLSPALSKRLESTRSAVDLATYDSETYLNLNSIKEDHPKGNLKFANWKIVLKDQHIIVISNNKEKESFPEIFNLNSVLKITEVPKNLLIPFMLLESIVDTYYSITNNLEDELNRVELKMLTENYSVTNNIYRLSKSTLKLEVIVSKMQTVISNYTNQKLIEYLSAKKFKLYLSILDSKVQSITTEVHMLKEYVSQAITIYSTSIDQKRNSDMNKISAWGATLLVPTLIASIYGMNFTKIPFAEWKYGFGACLLLMITVSTSLYFIFKKRKLL